MNDDLAFLLIWALVCIPISLLASLGIVLFLAGAARLRDDEVARRQSFKERGRE